MSSYLVACGFSAIAMQYNLKSESILFLTLFSFVKNFYVFRAFYGSILILILISVSVRNTFGVSMEIAPSLCITSHPIF